MEVVLEQGQTTYKYNEVYEASLEYFEGNELASKVFADKYALRNNEGEYLELTPTDMHWRIANEFARIEAKKFTDPLSAEFIFSLIDHFSYIVPQGSPMYGIGNYFVFQSLGNCYTVESPHDSYGGILNTDQQLAQLMKRRAGVGVLLDNIRPKGMPTKNSAVTTDGIGVFMERFSNTTREVAQSGRRGALLEGLNVHHPEIETFINIKKDKRKVTGANVSVLVTQEFIDALNSGGEYEQRFPVDPSQPRQISRMVPAKKIWDQIIESVWESADPGILFIDNARKESTSHPYHVIDERFADIISNPCVSGDTKILIKDAAGVTKNVEISSVVNKTVTAWTGFEWAEVIPRITGHNKQLLKITTSDGKVIRCTKDHMFLTPEEVLIRAEWLARGSTIMVVQGNTTASRDVDLIEIDEIADNVYCALEHKHHILSFNGFVTKNCGEIIMGRDACRLLLLNLYNFVENPFTKEPYFNFDKFAEYTRIAQRLMDDLVDLEEEKIINIINKIQSDPEPAHIKQCELSMWEDYLEVIRLGRRTGLGITALGDTLAALGIKYGSKKSIETSEEIYRVLAVESMRSSCLMAEELGAFPLWDKSLEEDCLMLNRILGEDPSLKRLHNKVGRRNISLTTTAPAGSVSIETDTTSGIEPAFLLSYLRRRKIKIDGDQKPDFIDDLGDWWEENEIYHSGLKKWMEITGKTDITKSPYYGATSADIDWSKSVELQAACQKWVTHSISKTCNVPSDTTKEMVDKIYRKACEVGLKGFTLYRDGCKDGVLITKDDSQDDELITKTNSPKRPKTLPCDVYHVTVKGVPYFVLLGLFNGEPYEVFAGKNGNGKAIVPNGVRSGTITKKSRGKYHAEFDDGSELLPITAFCQAEEETITRLVSTSLRHGTDIAFLVHQLEKADGDMQSFSKCIARALKRKVKDGTKIHGEECPECHSELVREEGCINCKGCGFTKCG